MTPTAEDRARFDGLAAECARGWMFKSNTAHAWQMRPFQRSVAMGEPAVPLVLEELRRRVSPFWFEALEALTGHSPEVAPADRGKVDVIALAWVTWGVERGRVAQADVGR